MMGPLMNALMPGENNWMQGKPMPGQVQQAPTPMQQQPAQQMMQPEPAKRGGFIGGAMNALGGVLKYGAPEAYEEGRQQKLNRNLGNALADGNYEQGAQEQLRAGNIKQGLAARTMGQEQQDKQRKQEAQGVLQLFTSAPIEKITEMAMNDPVGFERITGMSGDEYMQQGERMAKMGMTPQEFQKYVVSKAQDELGQTPKQAEGFTLGKDQVRYDAQGNQIAAGPEGSANLPSGMYMNPETGRPEYLPGYIEGQRQIAEARGSNANNVQSTFTGADGTQYIVRRDGSLEPLGVKARNPYQITDVGGVPTAIDRLTGQGQQVTSPETVGTNKATIDTITEQEKFRREQQQNLPKEMATINRGVATLEALKNSPGFDKRYGLMSVIPVIPGTEMADTQALINQIGGQAFLTAFESLKGGGQITEIEGQKATQAMTTLTTQGIRPETAAKAIEDLIAIQKAAASRMQAQASGSYAPQGADAPALKYNPETGEFE